MIEPYLNQIQTILFSVVKYYKVNTARETRFHGNLLSSEEMEKLQYSFPNRFSDDLKTFLNWSCKMPLWKIPFFPFVEGGKDFSVWSEKAELILIPMLKEVLLGKPRLWIMQGYFVDKNKNENEFRLYVDVQGIYFAKREAVLADYRLKPADGELFDIKEKLTSILVSDNIQEFVKTYLEYLGTFPIKQKKNQFDKLDLLLDNPKKLFEYVKKFNWDDGEEEMVYIVNSNKCDKATALLIYWLSQPYFTDEETSKTLNLLSHIVEENFKKDIYKKTENHFDPRKNGITDFIGEYQDSANKKREIPEFILKMVF